MTRRGSRTPAGARLVACASVAFFLARTASAQTEPKPGGDKTDEGAPAPRAEEAAPSGETAAAPTAAPFSFNEPFAWPIALDRVAVNGYVLPQFEIVSLPSALPRDQLQYGARGSRAGFALHGMPYEGWSYMVHLIVIPAGTEAVALLSPTNTSSPSTINVATASGTSIDIEEATIGYRPVRWYQAKVGFVRIPFSVAQVTPVPKQMFPIRPTVSGAFQNGADVGFLNTLALFDARLQANAGVYLGSSLGLTNPNLTFRGAAFSGSIEAHPLGAMKLREGDQSVGPFRFALGVASIYRRATAYDATGYEASQFTDVRLAASVRASWQGLYVQGEYLRRLQTDNVSDRPSVAEAVYAEASLYLPVAGIGFGPIIRGATMSDDQDFAPRKFTSFEGGLAFYPRNDLGEPERLRIIVEYLGASVSPLSEVQREGLLQLQLEW